MKTECDYLNGWIKKRSHTQKSHPKVVNPRDIAGERKKKQKTPPKNKKTPKPPCSFTSTPCLLSEHVLTCYCHLIVTNRRFHQWQFYCSKTWQVMSKHQVLSLASNVQKKIFRKNTPLHTLARIPKNPRTTLLGGSSNSPWQACSCLASRCINTSKSLPRKFDTVFFFICVPHLDLWGSPFWVRFCVCDCFWIQPSR